MIGDAFVRVECDFPSCKETVEIELTALAGRGSWDERDVKKRLEREGWIIEGDETFCEEHAK